MMEPTNLPQASSFNEAALLALGRLEAVSQTIVTTQIQHAASIKTIETRLNDLSAITQSQVRHDAEIADLKKEVSSLKEARAWLVGVCTTGSAVAAFLIHLITKA